MSGSITVILASLMLVSLVAVFAMLSFERVYVRPGALASLVAEELGEVYGYRVLSLGVNCIVVVNETNVTVRLLGLEASSRIDTDRAVVPSKAAGNMIVLYGNSTHVWVSSQIEFSPVKVKSSIYEVVFTDIGFENSTVSPSVAVAGVSISGVTIVVERVEEVPIDKKYWGGVVIEEASNPLLGDLRGRRYTPIFTGGSIKLESYSWNWRYVAAYIKNPDGSVRAFTGTVKAGFRIFLYATGWKPWRAYSCILVLDPAKVEEIQRRGYAYDPLYKAVRVGGRGGWREYNVTLSYDSPYAVGIGGYQPSGVRIYAYIKSVRLYWNETTTTPGEFEGEIVGVRNTGNRIAKIRVRLLEGSGLLDLKIWLNGTLQIDLENGLTEGSWVTLKPGETLIVRFYGRDDDNDYGYRLVVDCADAALNVVKQLSLEIEDA